MKQINCYKFDELSIEAKEKVHNDYLSSGYLDFDLGYICDDWTEKLEEIGFESASIHYSIGGGHGDGACFDMVNY